MFYGFLRGARNASLSLRHLLGFFGIRVAEIKKNLNVKDWAWIPTHANPAVLGTRTNVVPADLGPDSFYRKRHVRDEWTTL